MMMQTVPDRVDFPFLRSLLEKQHRVALFIRHSERPPIPPEDKDFGRAIGLTPRGEEMARQAGRPFAGVSDVRFCASPMTRCRLTARHLAEGMGLGSALVEDADPLGVRGFYYEDAYHVQDAMRLQGYMPYMLTYLQTGNAPYSAPIGPATEQMADWLQTQTTASLNIFVSHDIFIASFLTTLRLCSYTAENWVGFLHGAALAYAPSVGWVCYACLPSLTETDAPLRYVQ